MLGAQEEDGSGACSQQLTVAGKEMKKAFEGVTYTDGHTLWLFIFTTAGHLNLNFVYGIFHLTACHFSASDLPTVLLRPLTGSEAYTLPPNSKNICTFE